MHKYKLNIDFQNNNLLYSPIDGGHKKPSKLKFEDLVEDPDFMNNFSGKDGYLIGTVIASKSLNKLSVASSLPRYNYLVLIAILFVTIILLSNVLSTKLISVGGFTITGAMLLYPFSYIFDYIITDIYGYQNARRILLSCLVALILFDICIYLVIILPPSPFWTFQPEFETVFSRMLRTYVASTIAFSVSFFISSYIFQKLKVKNKGRSLFKRIFQSLLISEISDTSLFCFLSFYGVWPVEYMMKFILVSYFTKITYEIVVYSIITKPLIMIIKNEEKSDIIDWNTDFSPIKWEVNYDESNNVYSRHDVNLVS
ncbi:queuosine precursor transporter [Fluoribacter dumoffii]|uniref:Probable queuosine precursor transporter n=1 Tax=Fluoribacter dumoffii TaxID=463 RepID=A0A377IW60_9GAMM|nr:queuosine precursor transporter [Fluoribacter dumoffii]STO91682.1 Inner membrane protein yhhQ [Fluoribacter dumoffii]